MRHREQRLWDSLRANTPIDFWLQRVENGLLPGMPDVLSINNADTTWIELKAIEKWPQRPATPVLGREGLNPDQINWHLEWYKFGGWSVVLVGVGVGNKRELFKVDGCLAREINAFTRMDFARHKIESWAHLFDVIRRRDY